MDPSQVLLPITKVLSKNRVTINIVLLVIILLIKSNTTNFFIKVETHQELKSKIDEVIKNPWFMALMTLLIYAVYLTGNVPMLILVLFFTHLIFFH